MGEIIEFKHIPRPDLAKRTRKVSLAGLALSIQYFSKEPEFCQEAMSSIRRCSNGNTCLVTDMVYDKVMNKMDAAAAVEKVLYAS